MAHKQIVSFVIISIFLISGCSGRQDVTTISANASVPLTISTYDSSGQATHPDVIFTSNGWNNYHYWMAFTPYPNGDNRYENPSLRSSEDGIHWEIPSLSMPDPIEGPPVDVAHGAYNSDPDILLVSDLLYLYFRTTNEAKTTTVYLTKAVNVTEWSMPEATNLPSETASPGFCYADSKFECWYVEYTGVSDKPYHIIHADSTDGMQWSGFVQVSLNLPGYIPWHLNVIQYENEYEMLLTAFPIGNDNGHTELFHAWSSDGVVWNLTSPVPIIRPSHNAWDSREIYRSSMIKDSTGYRIWYSAAGNDGRWGIGYTAGEALNCLHGF